MSGVRRPAGRRAAELGIAERAIGAAREQAFAHRAMSVERCLVEQRRGERTRQARARVESRIDQALDRRRLAVDRRRPAGAEALVVGQPAREQRLQRLIVAEMFVRARRSQATTAGRMGATVTLGFSALFIAYATFFFTAFGWGPAILMRFGVAA